MKGQSKTKKQPKTTVAWLFDCRFEPDSSGCLPGFTSLRPEENGSD